MLILLQLERQKLYGVLAVLSAIELNCFQVIQVMQRIQNVYKQGPYHQSEMKLKIRIDNKNNYSLLKVEM